MRVLKLQDSDGQPVNKETRSERVKKALKNLTMPTDETDSTINKYYLTVLKNAKGINWIDEMEEWYRSASMDFLTREDIEGDNILHVFARKRKPGDFTEILKTRLSHSDRTKLLLKKNYKNFTPYEEAIENNHYDGAQAIYDFFAEHGQTDAFNDFIKQMSDIRSDMCQSLQRFFYLTSSKKMQGRPH